MANKESQQPQQPQDPDSIYKYDHAAHMSMCAQKPWEKMCNISSKSRFSAAAQIKMVMHACGGGDIEVMGLLQGKIENNTFIVMDFFALPVEGTETRVNAGEAAMEYMISYIDLIQRVGRSENAIGWYHSHPGYGCWLSGIDVSTQMLYQEHQEPWLAIVIDPKRTINSGKVEIGAFRTYPKDYKPPEETYSEFQTIPLEKIEDFGMHYKNYYSLEVSYFKSVLDGQLLDLLWNKYWVNTLSSSPLLVNRDFVAGQISDVGDKLEQAETQLSHSSRGSSFFTPEKKKEESQLTRISRDCNRMSVEQIHGLLSQVMKDILFNIKQ